VFFSENIEEIVDFNEFLVIFNEKLMVLILRL
jgi:hypothetical protein